MNDIFKKYSPFIEIGFLILVCSQVINYSYYNELDVDYEELVPFSINAHLFYAYSFLGVLKFFSFLILFLFCWKALELKGFKNKPIPKLIDLSLESMSWQVIRDYPVFFFELIVVVSSLFANKFIDPCASNLFVQLRVFAGFGLAYFFLKYGYQTLYSDLRRLRVIVRLIVVLFWIAYFDAIGHTLGENVRDQKFEEKFSSASFTYKGLTVRTDSSFTILLRSKDYLIMRKHPLDSNYYFKIDAIEDYRTGKKVDPDEKNE